MRKRARRLVIGLFVVLIFALIWQKTRIIVWVRLSFWQLLLLFVVLAVGAILVVDALFGGSDEH